VFEDSLRNIAFGIVRFSNYTAGGLIFGLAVVSLLVLRPALSRHLEGRAAPARYRIAHRLGSIVTVSIVVSVAATLIGLLLQSLLIAEIRGGDVTVEGLRAVLDNSFGFWYALRLPLLVALVVLLGGRVRGRVLAGTGDGKTPPPAAWWGIWVALGLGLLITNSMSGHAAASSPAALAVANDLVHFCGGAIWFSGIVVLAAVLPEGARRLEPEEQLGLLAPSVVGFSRVAVISIAIVGLTGTVNSFVNIARFSDLFDSNYGRALTLKIVMFGVILFLGGVNHFYVRNRMRAAMAEKRTAPATNIFRKTIVAELVFGVAILAITAVLAGSARTRQYLSLSEPAAQHESSGHAGESGD
jgi:putative copper export protein